jgi:hypothetical protein
MEVHAHTHTPRKKWTHYFWEFLMLFLAVFCGFLAEYQLEHKIEKDREKVYINSMIDDLKSDTLNIGNHLIFREDRRRRLDSLSLLLHLPDYANHTGLIYYYARWGARNPSFFLTDRTISQLKNSGGMRLITRARASNAITAYDAQIKFLGNQSFELEQESVNDHFRLMTHIFAGKVLDEIYGDSILLIPDGNPPLLTGERKILDQFASHLHFVKSLNNRNHFFEMKLKQQAAETIEILKREYRLQ